LLPGNVLERVFSEEKDRGPFSLPTAKYQN